MKQICVVGVGYVGLVTGACFADLGNKVMALDVDEKRIENLRKGVLPIYEPGLDELVKRNMKAGQAFIYDLLCRGHERRGVCVYRCRHAVGSDGEADLQYVAAAAKSIAAKYDRSADHYQQIDGADRDRRLGRGYREGRSAPPDTVLRGLVPGISA